MSRSPRPSIVPRPSNAPRRSNSERLRRRDAPNRRTFLRAGALGAAGLSLPQLLRHEAAATTATDPSKRQNSVIILWMRGGPSQHETWDPKPAAPVEVRGAFGAISTSVPGIQIVDLLPECAKIMHKWSIVRSMYHDNAGHSAGDQICFTGYPPGPVPEKNVHPSCGSIVSKELGHTTPELPAYVLIPKWQPATDSAYLGIAHQPFTTVADPANDGPFTLDNFSLSEHISRSRLSGRKTLLADFDRLRTVVDQTGQMEAVDVFQQRAWDILSSQRARQAFDLDAEDADVREEYGFIPRYDPMDPRRCSAN
ncbi:MAG: DUF1501 domain-containing protein, partial [Planctomycetales bacterium]|nr:DUF1501 domain-containing protein [Planctomycetales bacterium]